jgi:hypothetical protein
MKILLPLLFCIACALLSLSQHRPDGVAASGPPSPALLEAMSSHGIEVGAAAEAAEAPAEIAVSAEPQPATYVEPAPTMQPVVYRRNGR